MAQRRALVVAPVYGGNNTGLNLTYLSGTANLGALVTCLRESGHYEVNTDLMNTRVTTEQLQKKLEAFFDVEGAELLFYFYGHGCLHGKVNKGMFATSNAAPAAEGLDMSEAVGLAIDSPASEVILLLDCCHGGATNPAGPDAVPGVSGKPVAILAACKGHQESWETTIGDNKKLGIFTALVLDGLQGKAAFGTGEVTINLLAEYVRKQCKSWKQQPIFRIAGASSDHAFVITSGFVSAVHQEVFRELCIQCDDSIQKMKALKHLHDLFQDLEQACRTCRNTFTSEEPTDYEQALKDVLQQQIKGKHGAIAIAQEMLDIAEEARLGMFWEAQLQSAQTKLHVQTDILEGNFTPSNREGLNTALDRVIHLTDQQSKLSAQLNGIKGNCPVAKVVGEARAMYKSALRIAPATNAMQELDKQIEKVEAVYAKVIQQIQKHEEWQQLDDVLRPAQEGLTHLVKAARISPARAEGDLTEWKTSHLAQIDEQTHALCDGQSDEWARQMLELVCLLQNATGQQVPDLNQVENQFVAYKSRFTNQFRVVDADLLRLCGEALPNEHKLLVKGVDDVFGTDDSNPVGDDGLPGTGD